MTTPLPLGNNDVQPFLLWQNTDGEASLWELNRASFWAQSGIFAFGGALLSPDTSANPGPGWKAIDTESVNDSGLTILRQNADGQASIVQMSLTDVVSGDPVSPNPGPSWKAIGMGDFNPGPDFFDSGDGQPDILWQNANGQVSIWEMNGNQVIGGGPVSPNPGPAWKAIGTGDFIDAGDNDILFQNSNTGQVSIWEMSGNTIIGGGPFSPRSRAGLESDRNGFFR